MTGTEIVRKYERLIRKIAHRAARQVRGLPSHDADDFYTIGAVACIEAVRCFDPAHGTPEAAWVARLMRQAMSDEVAKAKARGFRYADGNPVVVLPAGEEVGQLAAEPEEREPEHLEWLQRRMRILTADEQRVLRSVLSGQSEVAYAAERGVSKQRINQLKAAAIAKLQRSARLTFGGV